LSDELEPVLQKAFEAVERVHGSRDYFHIPLSDGTFEVVPVLDAASWEEAANVTDMSPLHVVYVREHVAHRPWLAKEIRLTKQFMKSAKVYGAESYIGGFSGHVVDILIICYGSFRALLEAATKEWSRKVVLDPERRLTDPLAQLNASKTHAPLVIVDPVQQDRNSAAALTKQCFERLRERAKEYLDAAGDEQAAFFAVQPLDVEEFAARHPGMRVLRVVATPLQGKRDIVGAKCAKAHEHFLRNLGERGFGPAAHTWEFTPAKATFLYAVEPGLLPQEEDIPGPPVHMTDAIAKFQEAHATTFTHDGRVHALEQRRYRDALDLLRDLFRDEYIRERVRTAQADVAHRGGTQ
jgi:tRNA nucleotidyltransferase (CCA-adding enzyme)